MPNGESYEKCPLFLNPFHGRTSLPSYQDQDSSVLRIFPCWNSLKCFARYFLHSVDGGLDPGIGDNTTVWRLVIIPCNGKKE